MDSLCRLTVHGDGRNVDLALPTTICVGELMPSLLDLVAPEEATERYWRLSHVGGPMLDDSLTLPDNGVRDGDLLLLTSVATPEPRWAPCDPAHALVRTDATATSHILRAVYFLCFGVAVSSAVIWAGDRIARPGVLLAVLTLAAAVGAVIASDPSLAVVAVGFAAATGVVAVPAGLGAAHALLASAAALSAAVAILVLTDCGTTCLTALIVSAGSSTVACTAAVCWSTSTSATGALLAASSLAVVGVAPKLAIGVARVGPRSDVISPDRADLAHRVLTGLVIGSSLSTAIGAALVAVGHFRNGPSAPAGGAFIAVVCAALVLRARTHADPTRRAALVLAGIASAMAGFGLAVAAAPHHAQYPSIVAAAVGAAMIGGRAGHTVGPVVGRAIEIVEYVTLAAVIPLACWVGGVYGLVRGVSLI